MSQPVPLYTGERLFQTKVAMALTRDDVLHDRIRKRLRDEAENGADHQLLSEEEFEASRADILSQFNGHEELWIFGYGSLIWSPTFEFVEQAVAHLPDHARKFCLWAPSGRGSPEQPGLWLALDDAERGHSCTGVAFRIDNAVREHELLMLWRREMVSGAYQPRVIAVEIQGALKPCVCLLANKSHPRYTGPLSAQTIVSSIAMADGHLGSCREYLYKLVDGLNKLDVDDADLNLLVEQVRQYRIHRSLAE
ncbi:MAG: gamma-glutamylcyclotransferase [Burkholderiaceae bacterium]